jgi:hypothetical protein
VPYLEKYEIRKAEDQFDEKLIDDVKKYGFHIIGIASDGDLNKIEYSFTVGCFYSFGIPEVIIHGMRFETAKTLTWNYVDWAKTKEYIKNMEISNEIANIPIRLRYVDFSWYKKLLGYGIWFYYLLPKPFPCLQLNWPDPKGKFDDEVGYDEKFRIIQPDLTKPNIEC